jgi:hypothetical protein
LPGIDRTRLGLGGSPTRVIRIDTPPERAVELQMLEGDDTSERVSGLVDVLAQLKCI